MFATTCSCLICLLLAEPGPGYVIKSTPTVRIEAVLENWVGNDELAAREWVVHAARPPRLPCQVDTSASLAPSGRPTAERGPLKRPLLWARLPVKGGQYKSSMHVRLKYRATLVARKLVRREPSEKPPQVAPLTPRQRRGSLLQTKMLDFRTAPFPQWLDVNKLGRREEEGDIEYARRIFLAVKRNFKYEYRSEMDRRASIVCRTRKSDCAGLCAVFVAVLRAADLPARMLVGRWDKSSRAGHTVDGEPYFQTHVKAEFFAEDVGWVPVDLACAINSRGRGELRHFGNDPGDFLVLHVDDHIVLNTIHFGPKSLPLLQSVGFWVLGPKPPGGLKITERWQVTRRKVP